MYNTRPSFKFRANNTSSLTDTSGVGTWTYLDNRGGQTEISVEFNSFADAATIQKMLLHTYVHGDNEGFSRARLKVNEALKND